jgi:HK97 family phage major capsid protein
MNAAMRAAQHGAMTALNTAKALRTKYEGLAMSQWPADEKAQFDSAMADWTAKHEQYTALKNETEQFAKMDAAREMYEAPAAGASIAAPTHEVAPGRKVTNAFARYLRAGAAGLTPAEMQAHMGPSDQHALVGNVDSLGGFTVPEDFMSELLVESAGFSVIRPLARARATSRSAAVFMKVAGSGNAMYASGVRGSWRGEGWVIGGNNLPTQDQPRFGRERVPVHIWAPDVIELTMELLDDSSLNLDAELRRLLAETKALDEDSAFLLGSGVGQPMGIISEVAAGNIATVNSGAANAQSYAGLVNLYTSLPAQYRMRATVICNSFTLGLWALLVDTAGNPIFPTNELPSMLFGRPIVTTEFLADGNVNGNLPVIFGDLGHYGIADRMDLRITRLTERMAPNIGLLAVGRVGGQVLIPAAFRVQTVSA